MKQQILQAIKNFEDLLEAFENEEQRNRFGDLIATWIALARACTNLDMDMIGMTDNDESSNLRTTQVLMILTWLGDNLENIKMLLNVCQKAEINLKKDFLNGYQSAKD